MASDNEASCEGDPNFAVICDFFGKFGALCGLSSIDFLNLQEMLENTHEVAPDLVELHIKLMRKIRKSVAPERWERAIVNICHKYNSQDAWEVERFGYKKSRLGCKLRILKHLLEMQFDSNPRFKNDVNKMSAEELRTQPDGRDKTGHVYWFQSDENCHIRVYMEDPDEETWTVVAKNREGLVSLISELDTNDTVKIGSEPIVNEDSNSFEIEKPILDTGQNDSNSESSKPSKKSSDEEEDSTDSITPPKLNESIQITDSDSNSILPSKVEVKKVELQSEEKVDLVGEKKAEVLDEKKPELDEKKVEFLGEKRVELLGEKKEELVGKEKTELLNVELREEKADSLGDEEEELEEEEELDEEDGDLEKDEEEDEEEEEEEKEPVKVIEKPVVIKEIPKVEQKEEVKPVEAPQKIIGLRLKPITELLNQPTIKSVEEKKIEFSGIKNKYIRNDPFTSQMCNRKAVKSAGFVELYKPDLKRALEYDIVEPSNMKRPRTDRPTLLGNKKKYSMYEEEDFDDEVGEEIEEPLMLVTGEGLGKDNKCGNESPIVSETIEEPVLYFYGAGSGEDCQTGNEKEKSEEPTQSTTEKSKEVDSAKNNFIIGTVIDSKTTKKEVFRSPPKKSRWDIEEGTNVAKMVDKFENINKAETQDTTSPKKTSFFFGRGSGFAFKSPNVSPIKSTGLSFGSSFVKNDENTDNNEESNLTNRLLNEESLETKGAEETQNADVADTNHKVLGEKKEPAKEEENSCSIEECSKEKDVVKEKDEVKENVRKVETEEKEPSKQETEKKLKNDVSVMKCDVIEKKDEIKNKEESLEKKQEVVLKEDETVQKKDLAKNAAEIIENKEDNASKMKIIDSKDKEEKVVKKIVISSKVVNADSEKMDGGASISKEVKVDSVNKNINSETIGIKDVCEKLVDNEKCKDNNPDAAVNKEDYSRKRKSIEEEIPIKLSKCDIKPQQDIKESSGTKDVQEKEQINVNNESSNKGNLLKKEDFVKKENSLVKPLVEINVKNLDEESLKSELKDNKEKPVVNVTDTAIVAKVETGETVVRKNVSAEKVEENASQSLNVIDKNVSSKNHVSIEQKPEVSIIPSDLSTKKKVCLLKKGETLNCKESSEDSKILTNVSVDTQIKIDIPKNINKEEIKEKSSEPKSTKLEKPVASKKINVTKDLDTINKNLTISVIPIKNFKKENLNKKDLDSNILPKEPVGETSKSQLVENYKTEKSEATSHLIANKTEEKALDRILSSKSGGNKKVELSSKVEDKQESSKDKFPVDLSKTSNLIKSRKESVKPISVLPKKKSFKIDNLLGSKTGMHDKAVKIETKLVLNQPLAVEKSLVNISTPLDFSKSDSTNIPEKAEKSKITEYKNVEKIQEKSFSEEKRSNDGPNTLKEDVSSRKIGNTSQSKVPQLEKIVNKISNINKKDDNIATSSKESLDNKTLSKVNETKCDSKIDNAMTISNLSKNPVLEVLGQKKEIVIERIAKKIPETIKEKKANENARKVHIEEVDNPKLIVAKPKEDSKKKIVASVDNIKKVSNEKDFENLEEKKDLEKQEIKPVIKELIFVEEEVKPTDHVKGNDSEKVSGNCVLPAKSEKEKETKVEENSKKVDNNLKKAKENAKSSDKNTSSKPVLLELNRAKQTEESAIKGSEKPKGVHAESDKKLGKDKVNKEPPKIEETTKKELVKPPKKEIHLPVRQSQRRKNANLDIKVNTPTKEVKKDSKQENKTQGNNKRAKVEEATKEKDDNCQVDITKAAEEKKVAVEVVEVKKTEGKTDEKSVDLVAIESEIVSKSVQVKETKKDNLKNIQQGPTRTTRSSARNKNEVKEELSVEPVCIKKKAATLTQDISEKIDVIPSEASGNDAEEVQPEDEKEDEKPKKATLTSLSFDYTGTPSPPPAVETRLTRKRGRLSPIPQVTEEDNGGKRRKQTRGKRVNAELRKSIEEQKKKEVSSSEEDQSQKEKAAKLKPKVEPDTKKKDGPKKRRTLLGLDIPDISELEANPPGVRQSRRIAQIKIKEEAERRKIEELTMVEIQEKHRKISKKDEDKDYKAEKRKRNKAAVTEDETTNDAEFDDKKKRKKNKKPKNPKFDQYNPWKSSSDSSSESNIEDEEEEYEEEDDTNAPLKSDHEFSPESDLEDGAEVQPLKRARTVRKEDAVEEETIDDTNCQKCGKSDHPEWILLCDVCDAGWHCSCLRPALLVIPEGDWHCPPCQHLAVVKRFRDRLEEYDKKVSKRQIEVRRKERLAYVGISLDNVLPSKDHDDSHKSKNKRKQHNSEYESTGSESSSGSTATSTDSEDEPIYQLRQRRQAHSYRFNDYDDLINSAIREEVEAVQITTQIPIENKEIAPIASSGQEGVEQPENLTTKPELPDGTVPADPPVKKDEAGSEEEIIPPVKKFVGKKKHRKLNSLDDSSDGDQDSDEDFKGDSSDEEDEDEFDEEVDTDSDLDTRRGKRKGPVRRSTRARVSRYDREFINDDSEDEAPRRKKRSIWDESESEESDRSWGRRKKKSGSARKAASVPKKKKSKKKKTDDDSDVEVYRKKKPKIIYGGLESEEEDIGRRTRGKKITYVDALGSDSDDDLRRKNAVQDEDSEDEFVLNEEEDFVDEVERDSDDSNDDGPLVFPSVIKAKSKKGKGKGGIKRIKRAQGEEEEALFPPLPDEIKKKEETATTNADDKPNPIEQIIQSLENMDEKEMKEMMEDEEYANKQLQLVAAQLEKEKRRKEMEARAKALEAIPPIIPTVVQTITTTVPNVVPKVVPNVPHVIPNVPNVPQNIVSKAVPNNVGPTIVPTTVPPVVQAVVPPNVLPSTIPSVIPTFIDEPIDATKINLSTDEKTPKRRGRKPKSALTSPETSLSGNSLLPTTPFGEKISGEAGEFTEMAPLGLNPDGTPKKRRGRGKGKKTLEKEAAAAAAAAAANSSLSSFTSSKDSGDSSEPPISTSQDGMSSKTASPADSPMHGGKLGVAAAPQPFSQSQPVPSVITRMLQSQPGKASYPVGAMGYEMYGSEQRSDGPSPPIPPTTQGPPFIGGPRGVLPGPGYRPPLNHYPVIRGAPPPHRLRSPGPQNIPPSIYHAHHPMDPSPSGGGPIPVSEHATPAPSASPVGNKGPTPPPPPYVRPPLVRFPPGGGPLPRHPHILPQHLQARPYPGMPPNFHYGNFPPPGGDENGPPPGPFPYPEQFPPDGPSEGPKNYDEDNGEFGGLVSYFSSQREDDLDS